MISPPPIANSLAHDVLGRTLDELPPQTRKLLTTLHGWVKTEAARRAMTPAGFAQNFASSATADDGQLR